MFASFETAEEPNPNGGNNANKEYLRPGVGRGSSRGQQQYVNPRTGYTIHQYLAPSKDRIIEGYHGAQAQTTFYANDWPSHSMRSTRDRGMRAVPRWPNTLPWAYDKVAYAPESSGAHTRVQPQRTSYIEDPGSAAETAWMAKTVPPATSRVRPKTNGAGLGAVVRTSNPFMSVGNRVSATVSSRSRKRMPYTLDSRTFSDYTNGRDTGLNGLEYLLLHNHHLLPNTDEDPKGYAEFQYQPPSSMKPESMMVDEAENGHDTLFAQNTVSIQQMEAPSRD